MNLPDGNSKWWVLARGIYIVAVLAFMLWANYNRFDNRDWTTIGTMLLSMVGFDLTKLNLTNTPKQ